MTITCPLDKVLYRPLLESSKAQQKLRQEALEKRRAQQNKRPVRTTRERR